MTDMILKWFFARAFERRFPFSSTMNRSRDRRGRGCSNTLPSGGGKSRGPSGRGLRGPCIGDWARTRELPTTGFCKKQHPVFPPAHMVLTRYHGERLWMLAFSVNFDGCRKPWVGFWKCWPLGRFHRTSHQVTRVKLPCARWVPRDRFADHSPIAGCHQRAEKQRCLQRTTIGHWRAPCPRNNSRGPRAEPWKTPMVLESGRDSTRVPGPSFRETLCVCTWR